MPDNKKFIYSIIRVSKFVILLAWINSFYERLRNTVETKTRNQREEL